MADWAGLPNDILWDIGVRLTSIESYDSFGAVCQSWRKAATRDKKYLKNKTFQGLWFMLYGKTLKNELREFDSIETIEQQTETRELFNVSSGKTHMIFLPEARKNYCLSWKDWIFMIEKDGVHTSLLHMVSRVQIHLPDLEIAPVYNKGKNSIRKFILSANPNSTSDFIVMIQLHTMLVFCKPRDTSWTIGTYFCNYLDICYTNNKLCAMDDCTSNIIINSNVNGLNPILLQNTFDGLPIIKTFERYVIECSKNIIFVVGKYLDYSKVPFRAERFEVYKVNIEDGIVTKPAESINNLGNKSIFLGLSSSLVVDCSRIDNCKPNCIYFSEDDINRDLSSRDLYGIYLRIYHLSNGRIETLFDEKMKCSSITSTSPSWNWIGPWF